MSVCRSNLAARWLRSNGGTLQQAAEKFGVTFGCVSLTWHKLGFGPLPTAHRRIEAAELLKDGLPAKVVAVQVGLSLRNVQRINSLIRDAVAPSDVAPSTVETVNELLAPRSVSSGSCSIMEER